MAFRRVVDEVMLLPVRESTGSKQAVYSLNPTAAMLWEMIDGDARFDDLVAGLVEAYEVADEVARADVEILLDDLASFGAVVIDDHPR